MAKAVAAVIGTTSKALRTISPRKGFGGSQTGLILAPSELCRKLLSHGRLCVGIVSCRVRLRNQRVRRFQCLLLGHTSRDCNGPDRRECRMRCSVLDHKAAGCTSSNVEAWHLASQLASEALKDKEESPTEAEIRSAKSMVN